MPARPLYDLFHYSRLQLVVLAAVFTATCDRVLHDGIDTTSVLLVALGAYTVYGVDDLLDLRSDEQRIQGLERVGTLRLWWLLVSVSATAIALAALIFRQGAALLSFLALLGVVSLGYSVVSALRPTWFAAGRHTLARNALLAFVWCAVSVLTPVLRSRRDVDLRTLLVFVFAWQLSFVVISVWRLAEEKEGSEVEWRNELSAFGPRLWVLSALCLIPTAQALMGPLTGLFSWASISVVCCPILNLVLIRFLERRSSDFRKLADFVVLGNAVCGLLVLAVFTVVSRSA